VKKLARLLLWGGLAITFAGCFVGADSKSPTNVSAGSWVAIGGLVMAFVGLRVKRTSPE
jgi:membrane associated rhomboid family serine protease